MKTVFKTKDKRGNRSRPWYVVGPSRKLMLMKRAGGWTLEARVGNTLFGIYGTGDKFFTYHEGIRALKDAEAYVAEAEILSCSEKARVFKAAEKSKKRFYSE